MCVVMMMALMLRVKGPFVRSICLYCVHSCEIIYFNADLINVYLFILGYSCYNHRLSY